MDNSLATRSKVSVATNGLMVDYMKDGGSRVSNTDLELTIATKRVSHRNKASGRMESV